MTFLCQHMHCKSINQGPCNGLWKQYGAFITRPILLKILAIDTPQRVRNGVSGLILFKIWPKFYINQCISISVIMLCWIMSDPHPTVFETSWLKWLFSLSLCKGDDVTAQLESTQNYWFVCCHRCNIDLLQIGLLLACIKFIYLFIHMVHVTKT